LDCESNACEKEDDDDNDNTDSDEENEDDEQMQEPHVVDRFVIHDWKQFLDIARVGMSNLPKWVPRGQSSRQERRTHAAKRDGARKAIKLPRIGIIFEADPEPEPEPEQVAVAGNTDPSQSADSLENRRQVFPVLKAAHLRIVCKGNMPSVHPSLLMKTFENSLLRCCMTACCDAFS
jgi:hypothetical protein